MATRSSIDEDTRTISVDSGTFFFDKPANCMSAFSVDLQEQITLTGMTEVCLSHVYITGYKMNEIEATHYAGTEFTPGTTNPREDVVNVFNIQIPQFVMKNVGGRYDRNSFAHKRFSLANENIRAPAHPGLLPEDHKPFILGHLGQTAIFISTIVPYSLTRLDISITDQDGKSIFKENALNGSANPPIRARRIFMQFLLKTKKKS